MYPSLFGHRVTRRRLGNLQNRVIHCFFAARNILPVTNSNEIGQIRCLPWGPFSLFPPYQSHQHGKNGHWSLWFGFPRAVGILTDPWPLVCWSRMSPRTMSCQPGTQVVEPAGHQLALFGCFLLLPRRRCVRSVRP